MNDGRRPQLSLDAQISKRYNSIRRYHKNEGEMKLRESLQSDVTYVKDLVGAGWAGIDSARKESGEPLMTPAFKRTVWLPIAIGTTLGVLAACSKSSYKTRHAVLGGLVGSVVGFGGGIAWVSRGVTGAAARRAIGKVNTVRDARWLEKHPIAYA
jgi:hypothetical protein